MAVDLLQKVGDDKEFLELWRILTDDREDIGSQPYWQFVNSALKTRLWPLIELADKELLLRHAYGPLSEFFASILDNQFGYHSKEALLDVRSVR